MSPNGKGTAREALIAEAVGDAGKLLDGVERLLPALNASHRALADATFELTRQLADFRPQIASAASKATVLALQAITQQVERAALQAQTRCNAAMQEATREIFRVEADRALSRFAKSAAKMQHRSEEGSWDRWVHHACSAAMGALATWGLMVWLGAG